MIENGKQREDASMDLTKRQITKIAREASKLAGRLLRDQGVGTAEFDVIHVIRKNPGITQAGIREVLAIDKGALARQIASLEAKGFLMRRDNPQDRRSQLLYATDKADQLKSSKAYIESTYYAWLLDGLPPQERQQFAQLLDVIYRRSKEESKAGFARGVVPAGAASKGIKTIPPRCIIVLAAGRFSDDLPVLVEALSGIYPGFSLVKVHFLEHLCELAMERRRIPCVPGNLQ